MSKEKKLTVGRSAQCALGLVLKSERLALCDGSGDLEAFDHVGGGGGCCQEDGCDDEDEKSELHGAGSGKWRLVSELGEVECGK